MKRRRDRGFTLLEVLLVTLIMAVVGAAVISLMRRMSGFYGQNDDVVYATQSLRAATELMGTELRMASPADLVAAQADSASIRFDLVHGVVCDSTASDEATLFVYETVSNAGLTGSFAGVAFSDALDSAWVYADNWNPTPTATGAGPKATCVGLGAPGTLADPDYQKITGWKARFGGDVPNRGSLLRRYGKLTYRIAASTLGPGQALWRGTQELISPLDSTAAFAYVLNSGVQSSVTGAALDSVRAIRFTARALGDAGNAYNVGRTITYDIPLRN